jgi:hypothetical protein
VQQHDRRRVHGAGLADRERRHGQQPGRRAAR